MLLALRESEESFIIVVGATLSITAVVSIGLSEDVTESDVLSITAAASIGLSEDTQAAAAFSIIAAVSIGEVLDALIAASITELSASASISESISVAAAPVLVFAASANISFAYNVNVATTFPFYALAAITGPTAPQPRPSRAVVMMNSSGAAVTSFASGVVRGGASDAEFVSGDSASVSLGASGAEAS